MKNNLNILKSILLPLAFLIHSCQKQIIFPVETNGNLVAISKNWFENNILLKEKQLLSTPYDKLAKNDPARVFARMQKIDKLLEWNNAKLYNTNGINYVITPINDEKSPIKNSQASRSLIFYQDKNGEMRMKVLEIITDKNGRFDADVSEIMKTSFANMYAGNNKNIRNANANVLFYDESYHHEKSFKINNGVWTKSNFMLQNVKSTAKRPVASTINKRTTCGNCQKWYLVGYAYYLDTGEIVDAWVIAEWEEGDCKGNQEDPPYGDAKHTYCDDNPNDPDCQKAPPPPAPETVTTDETVTITEVNYVDEDYAATGSQTRIVFSFTEHIVRIANTREIISVIVDPITADPIVSYYMDNYSRSVTRTVTLYNQINTYELLTPTSVMINWSCSVNWKYSYSNGDPLWTRNTDKRYSKIVY